MSSSIQPPDTRIQEKPSHPLRPVSVNLSLFPRLIWSKESKSPSLTFTTSLVTEPERPSKKPRRPDADNDADDDNSLEAEIEGTKNEIRLLFAKLEALQNKKAAVLKPSETAAADGRNKKGANFSVNPATCCRQKDVGQSGKGGNPPVVKGRKPPVVGAAAAVCTKKPVKREVATNGNLKPRTLLQERQNPATGKRPANSEIMEVVSIPCQPQCLVLKRKRLPDI